jgi:hypothetical protein
VVILPAEKVHDFARHRILSYLLLRSEGDLKTGEEKRDPKQMKIVGPAA